MISKGMRHWVIALWGLMLASVPGSCGKVAEEDTLEFDSNTNWLMRCDADEVCGGSLRCYCGQCSQPCGQTDECALLAGAECAESGEAVCGERAGAGGLCVLGCSGDSECGFDFTCTANQCVPRPCTARSQTWDELYAEVANDISSRDLDDALFTRYVSLANQSSSGCRSLIADRQGLSKLVNSLSIAPRIAPPVPVDADETLYRIDLRDYGWERPVTVSGEMFEDGWEALVANNPYAVPFIGDNADDAVSDSDTLVPVMLANALIATATRADLYYALADIPDRLETLLTNLGIETATFASMQSRRAGFVDTGRGEFVATRAEIQTWSGYFWQIAELGGGPGVLFEVPLAEPLGEREVVFSLANGLQAFAYMSADGSRLDTARLVDPSEDDLGSRAPRSALRRHSPNIGVADEVRDFVLANSGNFDASTVQAVLDRYPETNELLQILESDAAIMIGPLEAAHVDARFPDPITQSFDDFQRDVSLADAAGDLMQDPEVLRESLQELDPALAVLDGGSLRRDAFSSLYVQALCMLTSVDENQIDPALCR